MYKLTPSDFAYLYEECKCCYYLKVRRNVKRPTGVFPAVFGAINTRLQGNMVGHDLQELSPSLPSGIVESQEKHVHSKMIPGTSVYIYGKYDLLVRQPDRTYLVIDLKLSSPNDDKIATYQSQLWSYMYAFAHPEKDEPKRVTRAGLLMFYPDEVSFVQGSASLTFPPIWLEVPLDENKFRDFIGEVSDILEGPTPPENPHCEWCRYRHLGESLAHPQTSDIPF